MLGLAKIAAAMANGGSLEGVKVLASPSLIINIIIIILIISIINIIVIIMKVLGDKGWKALHAKPTVGSLGKGVWEGIHITQVGVFDISVVDIFLNNLY